MIEDNELLRRYAEEKSEAAFAELVRRRIDLVYVTALRKVGGDTHLAEDVAQRVFSDLARKARELCRRPALNGWLFTGAHFAATQLVRAERRRRAREEKAEAMNPSDEHWEPAVDWERLRPLLDDLLGELGERDREAILLRFFENRPLHEIGARLQLSEDGARSRVDRAVDKLHALLARRGVKSTAALSLTLCSQIGVSAPAGLAASVASSAVTSVAAASAGAGWIAFMTTKQATAAACTALAGVLALNVTQQRANAHLQSEVQTLMAANRSLAASRQTGSSQPATEASPADQAELARLKAQFEELRKKISARVAALGGNVRVSVGGIPITADMPADEKLEIMYRQGRSSPSRSFQTLIELGMELAKDEKSRRSLVDFNMLALMFCLDDAARAKAEAFLATLPAQERARFRSPERLVASVFDQWLWKGDRPQSSPGISATYVPGDPTRAYGSWSIMLASRRTKVGRFYFKRFDDGWRYGPLSATDVEQMLAMLDPRTGQPKPATEAP
jgi:RNA polymerase sigma factor (sigma-70 family)